MPKKPSFIQLDPDEMQKIAIDRQKAVYDAADKYAYDNYGQLYPTRDADVARTGAIMAGGEDPMYQSVFGQSGLGTVDLGKGPYERSSNLRQPILSGAERTRSHWEDLWKTQGQLRKGGLDKGDLMKIYASNSGDSKAFADAIQKADMEAAQIDSENRAATLGAVFKGAQPLIGAGTTAATNAISNTADYYAPSNFIDPSYYTPAGNGIPFDTASRGGAYEGMVDGQPVFRAEPVTSSYDAQGSSGW